ncbi:MAG: hypothetical protein AMXMBFR72_20580 [Betaproteobacteria bacterium]
MNPALALAMVAGGGLLLAAGIVAYVTAWLWPPAAIAVVALGAALDVGGTLLFIAARRATRGRRNG